MEENRQYYSFRTPQFETPEVKPPRKKFFGVWINIVLFAATCVTTVMSGVVWLGKDPYDISNFHLGITYAALILLFLSFHEFGHYFAARYHKVNVTLPYYIPFFVTDFLLSFGTMGAVIRIRQPIRSKKALFDIGIAGPIAGFIIASGSIIYGLLTLPPVEYLYAIHPEYISTGIPPESGFAFANTLLYTVLKNILPLPQNSYLPSMSEIYHYPFLCAGWFGLFVTSLNLMPVGQLDGGHITYALLGKWHKYIARIFYGLLVIMTAIGALNEFAVLDWYNYGSLMWAVWLILILFVIKIDHPPIYDPVDLGWGRKLLGIFAFLMFICSFTPAPIRV